MKFLMVLCLAIACVAAQEARFTADTVEKYLKNERAYTAMYNCVMETGPCSPEGKELKRRLPGAIATGCGDCTEGEKVIAKTVINTVMKDHGEDWKKLVEKYDPKGEHAAKLEEFLKG